MSKFGVLIFKGFLVVFFHCLLECCVCDRRTAEDVDHTLGS